VKSEPEVERQATGAGGERRPHDRVVAAEVGVHGRRQQPELQHHQDEDEGGRMSSPNCCTAAAPWSIMRRRNASITPAMTRNDAQTRP
jgi:hypothetical protein